MEFPTRGGGCFYITSVKLHGITNSFGENAANIYPVGRGKNGQLVWLCNRSLSLRLLTSWDPPLDLGVDTSIGTR